MITVRMIDLCGEKVIQELDMDLVLKKCDRLMVNDLDEDDLDDCYRNVKKKGKGNESKNND